MECRTCASSPSTSSPAARRGDASSGPVVWETTWSSRSLRKTLTPCLPRTTWPGHLTARRTSWNSQGLRTSARWLCSGRLPIDCIPLRYIGSIVFDIHLLFVVGISSMVRSDLMYAIICHKELLWCSEWVSVWVSGEFSSIQNYWFFASVCKQWKNHCNWENWGETDSKLCCVRFLVRLA